MELKPETTAAIMADGFAIAAIRAVRDFLYLHHRDFSQLHPHGKILFTSDEAAIGWAALGMLIDDENGVPNMEGCKVDIGGYMLPLAAIHKLELALRKGKE